MNNRIIRFIERQKVASICCIDANIPYCFSAFYAFDSINQLLIFKSSASARHSALLEPGTHAGGTILPDRINLLTLKGIQFNGQVLGPEPLAREASAFYHTIHPYALAMPGEIFVIRLDRVKMTDNTAGFGKKIIWERMAVNEPVDE